MGEYRVQVCVTGAFYDENGQDAAPFAALEWPQQHISLTGYASRDAACAGFLKTYNKQRRTNLELEDFRFFGPVWCTADVHQIDNDTWQAETWYGPETPMLTVAATEDEVKAEHVAAYAAMYLEREPNAFPRPLAEENFDWTYSHDKKA